VRTDFRERHAHLGSEIAGPRQHFPSFHSRQGVARAQPGVIGKLLECRGDWCRIDAADHAGRVQRGDVWGVYPDEVVQ
jgi:SH3-like domain-containing protein